MAIINSRRRPSAMGWVDGTGEYVNLRINNDVIVLSPGHARRIVREVSRALERNREFRVSDKATLATT